VTVLIVATVLWLVGVSTVEEPWYIITELLEFGDLKNILIKVKESQRSLILSEQLQLCQQIIAGMAYLASKKVSSAKFWGSLVA